MYEYHGHEMVALFLYQHRQYNFNIVNFRIYHKSFSVVGMYLDNGTDSPYHNNPALRDPLRRQESILVKTSSHFLTIFVIPRQVPIYQSFTLRAQTMIFVLTVYKPASRQVPPLFPWKTYEVAGFAAGTSESRRC